MDYRMLVFGYVWFGVFQNNYSISICWKFFEQSNIWSKRAGVYMLGEDDPHYLGLPVWLALISVRLMHLHDTFHDFIAFCLA